MGSSIPKQFICINDKPVVFYTLETFLKVYPDFEIILVLPNDHLSHWKSKLPTHWLPRIQFTAGGATRYESVKNGLQLVSSPSMVFVHDGVRCMVSEQLIKRCYEAALQFGNAVPAIQPVDSMRWMHEGKAVAINRNELRIIQTPQTFHSEILLKAFQQEYEEGFTDEASVVEKMGEKINLVEGELINLKITRPIDLEFANVILKSAKD